MRSCYDFSSCAVCTVKLTTLTRPTCSNIQLPLFRDAARAILSATHVLIAAGAGKTHQHCMHANVHGSSAKASWACSFACRRASSDPPLGERLTTRPKPSLRHLTFLPFSVSGFSADSGIPVYDQIADDHAWKERKVTYSDLCKPSLLKTVLVLMTRSADTRLQFMHMLANHACWRRLIGMCLNSPSRTLYVRTRH
jgi:hypothetical protein